jgi:hypothetical protein
VHIVSKSQYVRGLVHVHVDVTSVYTKSQVNGAFPCAWIKSDMSGEDWRPEQVRHPCVTIGVASKLKTTNIQIKKQKKTNRLQSYNIVSEMFTTVSNNTT